MRWIKKKPAPHELTEWQVKHRATDPNFGYDLMRLDHGVTETVTESLLQEQGLLCAYTGVRIDRQSCHIEHVAAQAHGGFGHDVDYGNMVACYPAPNKGQASYGAHPKRDWPSPTQRHLFVSPLERGCEERFRFNRRGEIAAEDSDEAARTTINRLKLDDSALTALRREAIQETLRNDALPLDDARKRLRFLQQSEHEGGKLEPFCFALKQALARHIKRVEVIRANKASQRGA